MTKGIPLLMPYLASISFIMASLSNSKGSSYSKGKSLRNICTDLSNDQLLISLTPELISCALSDSIVMDTVTEIRLNMKLRSLISS